MICDRCEQSQEREERSRDYYDGISDGIRHAIDALECAYGYKDEDMPKPAVAVLAMFGLLLDDMESRRRARFLKDTSARVLTKAEIEEMEIKED